VRWGENTLEEKRTLREGPVLVLRETVVFVTTGEIGRRGERTRDDLDLHTRGGRHGPGSGAPEAGKKSRPLRGKK